MLHNASRSHRLRTAGQGSTVDNVAVSTRTLHVPGALCALFFFLSLSHNNNASSSAVQLGVRSFEFRKHAREKFTVRRSRSGCNYEMLSVFFYLSGLSGDYTTREHFGFSRASTAPRATCDETARRRSSRHRAGRTKECLLLKKYGLVKSTSSSSRNKISIN